MPDPSRDTRRLAVLRDETELLDAALEAERRRFHSEQNGVPDTAAVFEQHPPPAADEAPPGPLRDHLATLHLTAAAAGELDWTRVLIRDLPPLGDARDVLLDELVNPVLLDAHLLRRGTGSVVAPGEHLAGECRDLLDRTEGTYERAVDGLLRGSAEITLARAAEGELVALQAAGEWAPWFKPDQLLPALASTLSELRIDLRSEPGLDNLRGALPVAGLPGWRAFFQSAGETLHVAGTDPALPYEQRGVADPAVPAAWGLLLAGLLDDPEWLARRLDFPKPAAFAAESAALRLMRVRRHAALHLYELELWSSSDPLVLRPRHAELLGDALKVPVSESGYLVTTLGGWPSRRPPAVPFAAATALRAHALEAQLREFLREELGRAWFGRTVAGSLLRELWTLGQNLDADALMRELGGSDVTLESVADRIEEQLR